jgi:hypothetical protein
VKSRFIVGYTKDLEIGLPNPMEVPKNFKKNNYVSSVTLISVLPPPLRLDLLFKSKRGLFGSFGWEKPFYCRIYERCGERFAGLYAFRSTSHEKAAIKLYNLPAVSAL